MKGGCSWMFPQFFPTHCQTHRDHCSWHWISYYISPIMALLLAWLRLQMALCSTHCSNRNKCSWFIWTGQCWLIPGRVTPDISRSPVEIQPMEMSWITWQWCSLCQDNQVLRCLACSFQILSTGSWVFCKNQCRTVVHYSGNPGWKQLWLAVDHLIFLKCYDAVFIYI